MGKEGTEYGNLADKKSEQQEQQNVWQEAETDAELKDTKNNLLHNYGTIGLETRNVIANSNEINRGYTQAVDMMGNAVTVQDVTNAATAVDNLSVAVAETGQLDGLVGITTDGQVVTFAQLDDNAQALLVQEAFNRYTSYQDALDQQTQATALRGLSLWGGWQPTKVGVFLWPTMLFGDLRSDIQEKNLINQQLYGGTVGLKFGSRVYISGHALIWTTKLDDGIQSMQSNSSLFWWSAMILLADGDANIVIPQLGITCSYAINNIDGSKTSYIDDNVRVVHYGAVVWPRFSLFIDNRKRWGNFFVDLSVAYPIALQNATTSKSNHDITQNDKLRDGIQWWLGNYDGQLTFSVTAGYRFWR